MTYRQEEYSGHGGQTGRVSVSPTTVTTAGSGWETPVVLKPIDRPRRALSVSVVAVEDASSLSDYLSQWETLAETALEPNVFYEPWMLLPAINAYGTRKDLFFVLVFVADTDKPLSQPVLSAMFPIERHRRFRPLPVNVFSLWRYPHCYLCTPLLKAEYARLSLSAFLDWLISNRSSG